MGSQSPHSIRTVRVLVNFVIDASDVCMGLFGRSVKILDQQRDALPAADAGGGDAVARVRAFQLARNRYREPDPGRAERMADRDRAAVDVEFLLVEPERAGAGHHLRAKCLVDLEAI